MASQKDRMLAGQPYLSDDPELAEDRRRCRRLTEELNASRAEDPFAREEILRALLGSFGSGAEIVSPFHCDYGYRIHVGAGTFINFGAVILDSAEVRIGEDVQIGPGVHLATPSHPLDPVQRRTNLEYSASIVIEDGAWLATGVIVCPGVRIGAGSTVGAGSVVLDDLPPRHLCVGSPCRPVRPV